MSFSVCSSVGFSTGSSIVNGTGQRRFVVTGLGSFRYDLSRSWQAVATAQRGVDYLEGLQDPVISNTFSGAVSGAFGPHVDLSTSGGYTHGQVGLTSTPEPLDAYTVNVRVRALLTRMVGVYAEVAKYYQQIPQTSTLPLAMRSLLDRSSVRVGMVLSVSSHGEKK